MAGSIRWTAPHLRPTVTETPSDQDTPPAAAELGPEQARLLEREVETAIMRQDGVADCAVVFQGVGDDAGERLCVRCGITGRYPGIVFDGDGVCNLCGMYAGNRERIHAYFGEPGDMVRHIKERSRARGSDYDCLLLFSGGKDSTYVLHQLVDLGLRVMTFTFDNGFISKTALNNVEEITAELGIEHLTMTRADQNKIFLQSLEQHKSVCNGCFRSLLDLSTELAHERGIPTIVTGLSRGQIIDERLSWFYQQGVFDPAEIEPKLAIGRRIYHQTGSAIATAAVDSVEVVDYFRYSDVTKTGIREFLQRRSSFWSQPQDTGFCSSNCMINDVGVYVHNQERGYHNYEAPTRWEVRVGHLEIAEADEELRAPVNTARVKRMLAKIGYADPADRDRLGSRLVAYYVPRGPIDGDELRASVAGALPDILVPEQWVAVEEIPRAAGVVQREALAAPRPTRFGTDIGEEPEPPKPVLAGDLTVPLTPVQRDYLERHSADVERRGRALLLELPGRPDAARVRKVVLQLLLQHDALRTRLLDRDGERRQRDGGVGAALPVLGLDLSRLEEAAEPGLLRAAVDRMRARLSLTDGPVLQIALADRGSRPSWLLLVVHELVADTPSWRLILDDLCTAWAQTEAGTPVELPPAASFLGAAATMPEGAPAAVPAGWTASAGDCILPGCSADAAGTPTRTRVVAPDLAGDGTPDAARVLSAIATVLTEWIGGEFITIDVQDHTAGGDRDLGVRQVGPLTAVTKAIVSFDGPCGIAPRTSPAARIRYDHFGDLSRLLPAGAPFRLATRDEADYTVAPTTRPYVLSVNAAVEDGRLRLDWWCGPKLHGLLREADIPRRVAELLSRAGTEVT
ncbi:condensation domain-containing protein [Sphaerisporangium rhizosphaerae]|uniref:Condensation domain-containing protein n=1 Tax=Sphaerisporangium rhizosphaerae TaxID=2269375 RepID=A0ABW2PAB8_9ACTN